MNEKASKRLKTVPLESKNFETNQTTQALQDTAPFFSFYSAASFLASDWTPRVGT